MPLASVARSEHQCSLRSGFPDPWSSPNPNLPDLPPQADLKMKVTSSQGPRQDLVELDSKYNFFLIIVTWELCDCLFACCSHFIEVKSNLGETPSARLQFLCSFCLFVLTFDYFVETFCDRQPSNVTCSNRTEQATTVCFKFLLFQPLFVLTFNCFVETIERDRLQPQSTTSLHLKPLLPPNNSWWSNASFFPRADFLWSFLFQCFGASLWFTSI